LAHMGGFFGTGETEGDAAEITDVHGENDTASVIRELSIAIGGRAEGKRDSSLRGLRSELTAFMFTTVLERKVGGGRAQEPTCDSARGAPVEFRGLCGLGAQPFEAQGKPARTEDRAGMGHSGPPQKAGPTKARIKHLG
jgi:hypothetical protein